MKSNSLLLFRRDSLAKNRYGVAVTRTEWEGVPQMDEAGVELARVMRDALNASIAEFVAQTEAAHGDVVLKHSDKLYLDRPELTYSRAHGVHFGGDKELHCLDLMERRIRRKLEDSLGDAIDVKLWVVRNQVYVEVDGRIPDEGWVRTAYTVLDQPTKADDFLAAERRLLARLVGPLPEAVT